MSPKKIIQGNMKIPDEVMWVSLMELGSGGYVSSENYNKIQDIITRYPKWFVQEHIYNSIPQEVKDSFSEESSLLYNSFYPRIQMEFKEGGMVGWLNRQPVDVSPLTKESLKAALNYMFVEKPNKEKEYQKALEKLHNKHYKKYGYKFEKSNTRWY